MQMPRLLIRVCVTVLMLLALAGCVPSNWNSLQESVALPDKNKKQIGDSYSINSITYHAKPSVSGHVEKGIASWYSTEFQGQPTASGEPYQKNELTAAHNTLPMPTMARVTNLENGLQVIVRINDRGPFVKNRLIDLSHAAAKALGMTHGNGSAVVKVEVLDSQNDEVVKPELTAFRYDSIPEISTILRPSARDAMPPEVEVELQKPKLFVQFNSFQSLANAEKMVKKLQSVSPKTHIQTVMVGKRQFYRVRIGTLVTVDQADQIVETVGKLGLGNGKIVVD